MHAHPKGRANRQRRRSINQLLCYLHESMEHAGTSIYSFTNIGLCNNIVSANIMREKIERRLHRRNG